MPFKYTLKSSYTGKYITSYFSHGHDDTFGSYDVNEAYTWTNLDLINKVKDNIQCCEVVTIGEDNG